MFWPGEFHGLYSPWGRKESDTTEQLSLYDVYSLVKKKSYNKIITLEGNILWRAKMNHKWRIRSSRGWGYSF